MKSGREEITRELLGLQADRLAQHQKNASFGVPEGYFETFSQAVQQRIAAGKGPVRVSGVRQINLRTIVSLAASFVLLVGLGISFFLLQQGKEEGFLGVFDDNLYDEYFAGVTQYDRSLLYDLILEHETDPFDNSSLNGYEEDYLLEYLLDAAQYYGIEPTELIILNGTDNQR